MLWCRHSYAQTMAWRFTQSCKARKGRDLFSYVLQWVSPKLTGDGTSSHEGYATRSFFLDAVDVNSLSFAQLGNASNVTVNFRRSIMGSKWDTFHTKECYSTARANETFCQRMKNACNKVAHSRRDLKSTPVGNRSSWPLTKIKSDILLVK